MTLTDTVLDLAEDVTDMLGIVTSEVFVGLAIALGLVVWIVAGKRDGIGRHPEPQENLHPENLHPVPPAASHRW
jgi:hypothetical protein